MRKKIIIALLSVFIVLSVLSSYYLYNSVTASSIERVKTVVANYSHNAKYDYLAFLKPNNIFNRTIVGSDVNPLYIRIVDHINLNFTYQFKVSANYQLTAKYFIAVILSSPAGWSKVLYNSSWSQLTSVKNTGIYWSYSIDPTLILNLAKIIEKETGTSSNTYNVTIYPKIMLTINSESKIYHLTYTPKLQIKIQQHSKYGDIITFSSLESRRSGAFTKDVIISNDEVRANKYFSYLVFSSSLTGLIVTLFYARSSGLIKYRRKNKDVIPKEVKTSDLAVYVAENSLKEHSVIKVSSVKDLIKASEILGKPILISIKGDKTILYVFDGEVRYEFEIEGEFNEKGETRNILSNSKEVRERRD